MRDLIRCDMRTLSIGLFFWVSGRLSTCIGCHAQAKSDDCVVSVRGGLQRPGGVQR
jgi:hypothetical protein